MVVAVTEVEVVENRDKKAWTCCNGQRNLHCGRALYLGLSGGIGYGERSCKVEVGGTPSSVDYRKGSLSATDKENAEANDRAHDMNQKTIQALDTLAEEYSTFEATRKKVTF